MATGGGITTGLVANIPPGWPTSSANNGGQAFVYGFDSSIKKSIHGSPDAGRSDSDSNDLGRHPAKQSDEP